MKTISEFIEVYADEFHISGSLFLNHSTQVSEHQHEGVNILMKSRTRFDAFQEILIFEHTK